MELLDYEIKHIDAVTKGAAECTLFLNRDNSFPLEHPCKIAAYGIGVRDTLKGGTGSGNVNSRYYPTIEEALESAGFEVTTKDWFPPYEKARASRKKRWIREVKKEARSHGWMPITYAMGAVCPEPEYEQNLSHEGECAIYVVSRICGEGCDRKAVKGDFLLTDSEIRDILALDAKYEKFMVVLNVGAVVDLTPIKNVRNILLLSQLGVPTGTVLANILLGKDNPSGKLTSSWAGENDYCPATAFDYYDTDYREGIYVGYRYFNSFGKKPLYPFGYGLSYTEFEISDRNVSLNGEKVIVEASVKNIGKMEGKEVVQAYVSCPDGKLKKAYQELAGFGKTKSLKPGEEERIEIEFLMHDLASYDDERALYLLEKGNYVIRVGNSSESTAPTAIIHLDEDVITKEARNILKTLRIDEIERPELREEQLDIPVLTLETSSISLIKYEEEKPLAIPEEIASLSDEDLAYLNVGYFAEKGAAKSVVGESSKGVLGAAGETTGRLRDKIGKPLIFADGPAGLRVAAEYYEDEKGRHQIGQDHISEQLVDFMPLKPIFKHLLLGETKLKEGCELKTQYTTAIPIGTALAQSWNKDYQRECGDIVGEEMERFGVDVWLAPAMNIHRTPLCGRSFEYFSEDPLISGLTAANISLGVQSHKGCGVCIKHYACNNQEANRFYESNQVSERTLREIYLKGFAKCIELAQPESFMSSYNLLEGTHTSETKNLITGFLFHENHADGYVMTDWVMGSMDITAHKRKYDSPDPALVAASGHSLFMPGSKKNVKDIIKGLKEGRVSREQLLINASRMYKYMNKRK